MASPAVGCAFPVTVTRSVPSRSTATRRVSVGVSRVSPDLNVTGAREGSSTSRRGAAHVSIDSGAKGRVFFKSLGTFKTECGVKTEICVQVDIVTVRLTIITKWYFVSPVACQCTHVGNNCDANTGQCICPPNTIGERCDRCAPNHWGHDIIEGCKVGCYHICNSSLQFYSFV